ncbi:hypothetical protein E1295_37800 [Nonomuraea mesophila]|uniref:Uncharacterized protein n=1 Tax=Nonomuraea mesophila TaxID=2530382 RepID=A0A4R5EH41_9ACTN|nr:hypothetical protein [Nonomuraea mesophila]TDE33688.1 hypothetical protein E1295_37800 [Nonomuraea mesophila]
MTRSDPRRCRARRWPAYAMAGLFLGYAAGKAVFAAQAKLGFPGGPPVSAAEAAGYFLDPAAAQWLAAATGVAGAGVVLLTVLPPGRRVPRRLMLPVLAVMALAVAGGGGIMALDGLIGIGVGWGWHHGLLGLAATGLFLETVRSYAISTGRRRFVDGRTGP